MEAKDTKRRVALCTARATFSSFNHHLMPRSADEDTMPCAAQRMLHRPRAVPSKQWQSKQLPQTTVQMLPCHSLSVSERQTGQAVNKHSNADAGWRSAQLSNSSAQAGTHHAHCRASPATEHLAITLPPDAAFVVWCRMALVEPHVQSNCTSKAAHEPRLPHPQTL